MKQSWIHFTWAGVTILAFAAGYLNGPDSPAPGGNHEMPGVRGEKSESSFEIAPDGGLSAANDAKPGGNRNAEENSPRAIIKSRFFGALYESNQLERKRKVVGLLKEITAENWQGMIDSFGAQTIHTGRRHDAEWELALERAGEVAGSTAVEKFLTGTGVANDLHAGVCMQAWAAHNPKEAIAWFQTQGGDLKKDGILRWLVSGLAQNDPTVAQSFVESIPAEQRIQFADKLADGIVQHSGIKSAMEYVERAARSGDINYTRALFEKVGEKVFFANWVAKTPEEACRWVEGQLHQPYMTQGVIRHAAGDYAIKNPEEALNWLQQSVAASAPAFLEAGIGGVMMRWNDNAQVAAWLETHPNHPLRDVVTLQFSKRLASLDPVASEQWISTIKNEELRNATLRDLQARRKR